MLNSKEFDWRLVASFVAALDHGSLLAAARATGTSQPTLGRHLAELERQLGVALFERTGRGLRPLPAALSLADAARAMGQGADRLWRLAQAQDKGLAGRVRVTASQPVACLLLPPVLRRMRDALPEVVVELVPSNSVEDLLRRDADIAVRMVRPQQSALVARRIGSMAVRACAHRDYLRRRGTPQALADLLQHDLIAGDRAGDLERGAAASGFAPETLRYALRSDDLLAQWGAVRAGLGIGFTTQPVIRTDPEVVEVLPQLKLPVFPVWLAVHREIRTSARIRAVVDFLARELPGVLAEPR